MAATATSASDVIAQGTHGARRSIRSRSSMAQSFLHPRCRDGESGTRLWRAYDGRHAAELQWSVPRGPAEQERFMDDLHTRNDDPDALARTSTMTESLVFKS